MPSVWGIESRASREVMFTRRSIADGLRWAGTLMLCRQPYGKSDEEGGAQPCPDCYDPILKQVKNSKCKTCFGTGYIEGYKPAFVVRAHIQNNTNNHDISENAGLREEQRSTLKLACDGHFYKSGDLFAEVVGIEDGVPTKIGRVFQISGDVGRQTIQGLVSTDNPDAIMDLNDRMVSQQATARLLLETDNRRYYSDEFWGLDKRSNPDEYLDRDNEQGAAYSGRYHMSSWEL